MVATVEKSVISALTQVRRYTLDEMDHLSVGKKTRLHKLMYQHGPGNGKLLFLPIDQGLEHGPVDFFANPAAAIPNSSFAWRMKAVIRPSFSTSASLKNT